MSSTSRGRGLPRDRDREVQDDWGGEGKEEFGSHLDLGGVEVSGIVMIGSHYMREHPEKLDVKVFIKEIN